MSTTPPASQRSRTALISAAGLILAVAAEACSVGLLGLSGWFIASSAVAEASAYSLFSYLDPSAGVRAFALGRIAANYASRLALHAAALRRVAAARLGFYDRAAAEPGTHGTWSGQSLDRVMADADTSGMALIQATAPMITSAVLTAGGGLVIVLAGYPLVAVAVAVAVAACALLASAGPRHAGDVIQVRSALRTDLVTAAGAWAEMASLGAASQLADRTLRRLAAFEDRQYRQAAVTARAAGAARAVTAATLLLSVMLAATRGASVSMLVFLALLAAGVLANAERLIAAAHARVLATQASQRLTLAGRGQAPRPSRPPALHVAYDRRALTVSGYQLPEIPVRDARQIGFTAAPGQTLVITGASGSGKTTLLNAIAAALRQPGAHPGPGPVTTVLADDYLFTGTIASNIRLASPAASDDDVKDLLTAMLLDRAGLSPSTRTGTGGRDLSGGEQRRLHIARALATRPGMLLIDEPTTGLDARTDTHVLMAIRRRLPQAVLIMAMHGPPEDPDALGTAWTAVPLD